MTTSSSDDAATAEVGFPCACCAFLTRSEEAPGTHSVCPVCWWQDDDAQAREPDLAPGSNHVSLRQARANFRTLGASQARFAANVRPPRQDELAPAGSQALTGPLHRDGRVATSLLSVWQEAASLCAVLDAIGREGSNALVKIDGERAKGTIYTVLISGGRLGDAFFRRDGADLCALLREAIAFYSARVWDA